MQQVVKIIKGTDREILVVLKNGNDQSPFDLTGATVKAIFPGSSELVEITDGVSVRGDASRGEITVTLDSDNTSDMQEGERLTWEIEITKGGKTYVTQFREGLDVVNRLS